MKRLEKTGVFVNALKLDFYPPPSQDEFDISECPSISLSTPLSEDSRGPYRDGDLVTLECRYWGGVGWK